MTRNFWVWLHRWAGLAMAGFLVIVGLTGSLLAFWLELNHWLTPEMYPGERPGIALDAATLAHRAEAIVPRARTTTVYLGYPGSVMIGMEPREGAAPLDFDYIHLDPIDGRERGRASWSGLPKAKNDIMPFVYALHMHLAISGVGDWILGVVALVWTLDCFVGFYLTFPTPTDRARKGFLARWRPAWLVKWRGSAYRVNFDLHRACGLWLWAMLLIFAWSSVYMDLNSVYTRVTQLVLDYEKPIRGHGDHGRPGTSGREPMSWEKAQATGESLMAVEAGKRGLTIERVLALYLSRGLGGWEYRVRSSADIGDRYGSTSVYFDAFDGKLGGVKIPTGERSGMTVTTWLIQLHTANLFGVTYKVFVCILGVVIAILSGTGVYIWSRKRRARRRHTAERAVPGALAQETLG
ncbi:PepSY domain-containing protein [Methylosinus sp. PW1]|uniref:PepSY-associated TM helix domain-containing protein n=1 Tax=Methylosinus sp. PW1 TaxID=107636 RepID=UPI00055DB142|nr:PepSY-associated TM helix domain-containing protein [Methylosinus sp. PW1]